jgi:hypothetical protein
MIRDALIRYCISSLRLKIRAVPIAEKTILAEANSGAIDILPHSI